MLPNPPLEVWKTFRAVRERVARHFGTCCTPPRRAGLDPQNSLGASGTAPGVRDLAPNMVALPLELLTLRASP